jgi:hypothetical protein
VKITVERCDEFLVTVPQMFDTVISVALWLAKKKRTLKGYGSAATYRYITRGVVGSKSMCNQRTSARGLGDAYDN